ncbi:KR domain-containing protein [Trichoderma breve]|uniref:KR domain-containing protein n=1 Tax=Trichoderma breve TaxID=2034170 RepID=A0A9W9E5T6_9HYPO|nr:KR domain-containing protein [Trichoderma breve]KAJ4858515.1 KR domain-containing protein [Trichoderma breve]
MCEPPRREGQNVGSSIVDDIAIVGLALRFPGDATSPQKLWDVLERKESQWSEFPKDRLNIDGYYHPSNQRLGSLSFRGGHFLKDDISAFDAPFFSIPTEEANAVDPQQRILLEVSYEALENAGIRKEDIDGSDAAVYVGSFVKDYEYISLRDQNWGPKYAATGNGIAIMSNRISYFLNLHGPSMTVDTGCSSSLIAVHLAAQSLRTGETSLALAAGTGMILSPETMLPMTALNFLSPDGKCFTFDSRANGYGRGEGIGVVVMKRLTDAIRDNDTIHAVMRASNINQDGRTKGITFPSGDAQVANIRAVYDSAGLDFAQTGYIECHGTGTQAVDNPIMVGSIKTNIGHLEGAAGIAGLIKGVLALERGRVPPNINFIKGNPKIDFKNWRVKVPTEVTDWPIAGIRRVSVNSFGFGGSNAHVVIDEAPGYLALKGLNANHSSTDVIPPSKTGVSAEKKPEARLFCYSANDNAGVVRVMRSHLQFLESIQRDAGDSFLNYSYTLGCRRSNLEWKGFIIAESASNLMAKIQLFDSSHLARSSLKKQHKLGFVFCGQGSQWAKMGADLMSFNVYSASLKEASCFLQIVLGSRFDLLKEILRGGEDTRISDPEISQPATTALQVALVDLLKSFNIQPKYVLGHSSGEIAAAYASGAISRYDAWRIAYYRGLAAASIPFRASKLKGGMMVVGMSTEEVSAYLAKINKSAQIACINSPRSITISGQAEAIEFITQDLRQKNIFNRVLNVKVAYHSSHMKLVEDDYVAALDEIVSRDCFEGVRMFSSVTGKEVMGSDLNAKYWADNMVSPVQYVGAVQSLMSLPPDDLPDALVELSPSAVLRSPTADVLATISGAASPAYYSALERKQNGCITIFDLVGKLWSKGYPVNMKNVVSKGHEQESLRCLSNLPSYVWDHSKKYWHETDLSRENRLREYPRMDLIGYKVSDSIASFEPIWRGFLRISENPWIQDHQVQKTIVYPAAGMVSMVLEGARQLSKDNQNLLGYELVNMSIEKAMTIPNTAYGLEVSLSMKKDPTSTDSHDKIGIRSFFIYSRTQGRSWDRHASGSLRFHYKVGNWQTAFQSYERRQSTMSEICKKPIIPRQLYEHLDSIGMNYGPLFQNIVEVRKCDGHCVSRIKIPDTKAKMPYKFEYPHLLHPATLDSMIQTLLAIQPSPMVPVSIKSLFVTANLGGAESGADFTGYSSVSSTGIRNAEATIVMKQASLGQAYVVIEGLSLTALPHPSPEEGGYLPSNRNLCSQIMWKEDATFARPSSYIEQVAVLAHKYPGLSILQIGGHYELSLATLGAVSSDPDATPQLLRYTILEADGDDTAARFLSYSKGTSLQPFIEAISDFSRINNDYHLIVACTSAQTDNDLLKTKLKAGGVLLEQVIDPGSKKRQICEAKITSNIGNSQAITNNHLMRDDENFVDFIEGDVQILLKAHRYNQPSRLINPVVIITPKEVGFEVENFIAAINRIKETRKIPFSISSMAVDEAVEDPTAIDGKTVISLLEFSGLVSHDCSIFEWQKEDFDAFRVIQKRADHVFWVTRGALMSCENPRGSPIVGLSRTLISEDSLNSIVTFDLGNKSKLDDPTVVDNVLRLLDATFGSKLGLLQDTEFAEEGGKIYIPRLKTLRSMNCIIEGKTLTGKFSQKPFANNLGLQLTIEAPGISEDNLFFIKSELPELGAEEVEIAFKEAHLSVLDLEVVLGKSQESVIGADIRGKITRVGSEVKGLAVGDNVVALVADGSIKNLVRVKSQFVKRVATNIVPSFLVSAYFALIHIGRVKRGRKVLIHNGASAFGLTAIDMALTIGAEVFATIVGPEADRQREILERHGVSGEHILEADSGLFVAALLGATDGNGVDCLFNPTLDAFDVQFDCVRKCGSIIQFASKSSTPISGRISPTSITVSNWNLYELLREDPDFVAELLERATQFTQTVGFKPSPYAELKKVFDIGDLKDGLQHLQQTPHIGFVSLSMAEDGSSTVSVLNDDITKSLEESVESDGTYLLTGGLGGLGRSIAELLVNNGARHLAFVSRSGASSDAARAFLNDLQSRGIDAKAFSVDICNKSELDCLIKDVISLNMPPIRGVFQCAAVLRDSVFSNMTFYDWDTAIKVKTLGSWNLYHSISAEGHDPFYIFLASSSGIIGNRGQANYAAGNCFQDSFARYLQKQGERAVAIDLGPVLGAGMLAENEDILDTLRSNGFFGIPHEDFLTIVKHAITGEITPGVPIPPQITVAVGTGGMNVQINAADPYWTRTALYSYLNLVDIAPPNLLAGAKSFEEATVLVRDGLSIMLSKAMNMLPSEIDMNKSLNAYGVDSLVAVTIRNWILNNCGVQFSVFEILSDSPITEMANAIAVKGGYGGVGTE